MFVNANRDPKKGEPARPSDFYHFQVIEEGDRIKEAAANAFFSLVADEKMPSWAVSIAPIDKLRSSKNDDSPPQTRALMCRGVLLLAPQIQDDAVKVGLALVDGVEGNVNLIDTDSGSTYQLFIPNAKKESFWRQDWELMLG